MQVLLRRGNRAPRNDIIFITESPVTFFPICPGNGAFLFVLYAIGCFFCHHFIWLC